MVEAIHEQTGMLREWMELREKTSLSQPVSFETRRETKPETPEELRQQTIDLVKSPRQMALEWARANHGLLGLTYREMEAVAGIPRATLQRAIDGDPELKAVRKKAQE